MEAVKAQPCCCPCVTGFMQRAGSDVADLTTLSCNIITTSEHPMCESSECHCLSWPVTNLEISVCPVRSSLFGLSLQSSVPTLNVAVVFQKAASCENGLASPNYNSSLFCCQENNIISYLDYTEYYGIKTTTEIHCYFSFLISCLVTGIPPPAKFIG